MSSPQPSAARPSEPQAYRARRVPRTQLLETREGRIALRWWGPASERPCLLLHGWMDCAAGWQLLVDALPEEWAFVGIDWRGHGNSAWRADRYWFADRLAELEAVLDALGASAPWPVIAHSLGGMVASLYAAIRPERFSWLVNIEGFGMPEIAATEFPAHIGGWLDQLRAPPLPRQYASVADLARMLQRRNPALPAAHALYLAQVWTRPHGEGFEMIADPRVQLSSPVRYTRAQVEASWHLIRVPVQLLYGSDSELMHKADPGLLERFRAAVPRSELQCVTGAGHLLHHELPQQAAAHIERFASAHAHDSGG
jgi:pimeloyl-ACP methyl ester carboxylesterase